MSKFVYAREDSGRELVNGLILKPGKVYEVAKGDVRYSKDVAVIKADLCESLVKEGYLKALAEPKTPAPVAKAPEKATAGQSESAK